MHSTSPVYREKERRIIAAVLILLSFPAYLFVVHENSVHVTRAFLSTMTGVHTVEYDITNPHTYPVAVELDFFLSGQAGRRDIRATRRLEIENPFDARLILMPGEIRTVTQPVVWRCHTGIRLHEQYAVQVLIKKEVELDLATANSLTDWQIVGPGVDGKN